MPPRPSKSSGLASKIRNKIVTPGKGSDAKHMIVKARAGTGKTFVLIGGVCHMMRRRCPQVWDRFIGNVKPTKQQHDIWDAMDKDADDVHTIRYTAFNNSIVKEFSSKFKWVIEGLRKAGVSLEFKTSHGLGFSSLLAASGGHRLRPQKDGWNCWNVAKDILVGKGGSEQRMSKEEWAIMSWTRRLVEACKMWLLPLDLEDEQDKSHVWRLIDEVAEHYGVFVDEPLKDRTYTLTCQTIEGCKDFAERGEIDFVDMLWLPVILGLPIKKADLVLVDEGQDLNPVQQCLVQRSGGRIIMAGDDKQAINGFAGADVNGMDTMRKELGRSRGCEEFPLTVTMRCPKRVVREVKYLVPDFEAHEDNPEGHILESFQHLGRGGRPFAESYLSRLVPGDLVVCRTSGMLVRDCLTMIRQGHPSCIIGKSIGEELVNLINSLNAKSVDQLRQRIHVWASEIFTKESAKDNPNTQRMTDAENTADMILFFTDLGQAENSSVDWIKFLIRAVFTDDQTEGKIKFATIHKSKGLEATNVFFHVGRGCEIPHKKARLPWEIEQEYNLMYVAMTRSLGTLTYVR